MIKRLMVLCLSMLVLLGLCGCKVGEKPPKTEAEKLNIPKLQIIYCEDIYEAVNGSYSWTVIKNDGKGVSANADSLHPTQMKEIMPEILYFTSTLSRLDPKEAYLKFDLIPEKVTAKAWQINDWKSFDDGTTQVKITESKTDKGAQYKLEFLESPHIYEVTASFKASDGSGGKVSYCFYTVEKPSLEETENTNVYCGNTMTTVYFDENEKFTFMGENSVTLTDILRTLKYNKPICKCLPEYTVDTEFGIDYGINLSEKYVRYKGSQAEITEAQAEEIKKIIEWSKLQAKGL